MSDFLYQDNVDTELFPFFVEEAQETIKAIESALHAWHSNKADTGAIRTLRRSFHTLKGASNSIGHFRIGRVAGGMKTLLESIE
ncbi:MAG TPA: Hpt domain-containing protein, partial [Candidatus Methylacidiphilales bacterium]|nr:Hpt domain-containing protein [Candidatus Methylacidiphilales bacterium]